MKRLLTTMILLFNLVFVPSCLYSQVDFFPPGAEWFYGFSGGFIQVRGYDHFFYSGDTIIESRPSKIISHTTYYFDYDNPTIPTDTFIRYPFYMAQSGDSIFYYEHHDTQFQFLWKHDVQTGDMFIVPDEWDTYTMTIDSVKLQMYNSLEVKKIWISGNTDYGMYGGDIIYDRFGPVSGFHYYSCWGYYDCYPSKLCRYKSNEMGQIDFSGSACNTLTTDVKHITTSILKVYPNPFDETFNIDLPNDVTGDIHIKVYNVMGQLINSKTNRNGNVVSIHPEDNGNGIYFCIIDFEGKREVSKIIRIR